MNCPYQNKKQRSEERGKCFIEYIPAENAWVPIVADGYLYINCLWVSGSMKGHGYSNDLLEACIRDAKAQGKKGICILCAEGRKREFLADPKFLTYKGFCVADISDCGINRLRKPVLSSIIPTSVPTPIIGCQGCRRRRRSMVSRSRLSISLIKNQHRMYLHRSQPMLCFGTVSF